MRLLDITLPTPAENLALDEALLLEADGPETLRLWESAGSFVVLGRSSRVEEEVDTPRCAAASVPIHRRVSGGATIVTGPGCLMYAVVLDAAARPELRSIDRAHEVVLSPLVASLRSIEPTVEAAGTSDLACRPAPEGPLVKFSGNSVRVVRDRILYHGTLLYAADLPLIARLLREPPRQPDYRAARQHDRFIGNLRTDGPRLRAAIQSAWPTSVNAALDDRLKAAVNELVHERYNQAAWRLLR